MTDTTFGPEIAVNGKRPDWLGDDVLVKRKGRVLQYVPVLAGEAGGWSLADKICLPADHFAYKALDAGFEPWPGGDAAPADWDGGTLLFNNGPFGPPPAGTIWKLDWRCHGIIGYHKRTPAAATPADTVTITRMTEAEWKGRSETVRCVPRATELLYALNLIRPETAAERFTRETGHELPSDLSPEMRALVEAALAWERGK